MNEYKEDKLLSYIGFFLDFFKLFCLPVLCVCRGGVIGLKLKCGGTSGGKNGLSGLPAIGKTTNTFILKGFQKTKI